MECHLSTTPSLPCPSLPCSYRASAPHVSDKSPIRPEGGFWRFGSAIRVAFRAESTMLGNLRNVDNPNRVLPERGKGRPVPNRAQFSQPSPPPSSLRAVVELAEAPASTRCLFSRKLSDASAVSARMGRREHSDAIHRYERPRSHRASAGGVRPFMNILILKKRCTRSSKANSN